MKHLCLLFLSFFTALSTAFANPFKVHILSRDTLYRSSRNGEHALLLGSGKETLLWNLGSSALPVSAPESFTGSVDAKINNSGQILYTNVGSTNCDAVRREANGSFTSIATFMPTPPPEITGDTNLVCLSAMNDAGESAFLVGFFDGSSTEPASYSIYYSDGNSLQKIVDTNGYFEAPHDLFLTNMREIAYLTLNSVGGSNVSKISFVGLDAPKIIQKVFEANDVELLASEAGATFIREIQHGTFGVLDSYGALSRLSLPQSLQSLAVSNVTIADKDLVGQLYYRDFLNSGGEAGAFLRTSNGKYKSINCSMPNSVRFNFTNAAGKQSNETILAEIEGSDSHLYALAELVATGERITDHFCPKKLETSFIGSCAGLIGKNGDTSDIPVGKDCRVEIHVTNWSGLPMKNSHVLVTDSPTRGKRTVLKTDSSGRAIFSFRVGENTQFDGAVTVTAPYADRKVRSITRIVYHYDHEV